MFLLQIVVWELFADKQSAKKSLIDNVYLAREGVYLVLEKQQALEYIRNNLIKYYSTMQDAAVTTHETLTVEFLY